MNVGNHAHARSCTINGIFSPCFGNEASTLTNGKICGWDQNGVKRSTYSSQFMVPFTLNLTHYS